MSAPIDVLIVRADDVRRGRDRQPEADRNAAGPRRSFLDDAELFGRNDAGAEQPAVVGVQDELVVHHRGFRHHDRREVGARAVVRAGAHDAIEAGRHENRPDALTLQGVGAESHGVRLAIADLNQLVRAAVRDVVAIDDFDQDAAPRHRHQRRVARRHGDGDGHHLVERAGADAQHIAARGEGDPAAVLTGRDPVARLVHERLRLLGAVRHRRHEHGALARRHRRRVRRELTIGRRRRPPVEILGLGRGWRGLRLRDRRHRERQKRG